MLDIPRILTKIEEDFPLIKGCHNFTLPSKENREAGAVLQLNVCYETEGIWKSVFFDEEEFTRDFDDVYPDIIECLEGL